MDKILQRIAEEESYRLAIKKDIEFCVNTKSLTLKEMEKTFKEAYESLPCRPYLFKPTNKIILLTPKQADMLEETKEKYGIK